MKTSCRVVTGVSLAFSTFEEQSAFAKESGGIDVSCFTATNACHAILVVFSEKKHEKWIKAGHRLHREKKHKAEVESVQIK